MRLAIIRRIGPEHWEYASTATGNVIWLRWKYFWNFVLHECRTVTVEAAREDYGVIVPARTAGGTP